MSDKPFIDPERPDADLRRPAPAAPARDAEGPQPSGDLPPAGPHADPALTNPDATPGTGALPPAGGHDDVDSTSG
ncbi:MAG TPA: hypothetical protein VF744_07010 [Beijerinckiaceae bacterium]|jgi:hypothetical protein